MKKLFNEKRDRYYHRQVLKAIGLSKAPIAFGAEKVCYLFKNFVVFKTPLSDTSEQGVSEALLLKLIKQQNAEYLADAGIKTPRIVDIEFEGEHIYEIQERAPGQVMSYTNESNILNTFGEGFYNSIKDIRGDEERSDFCKKVLEHNFAMQKKLKTAPIEHFVEFVRGFKAIQEYGLSLDIHGENFLYDTKTGFWFVDLPPVQSTEQKKFSLDSIGEAELLFEGKKIKQVEKYREVSDFEVVKQILSLFVDFLKYSGFVFDQEYVKQMKKNNAAIILGKLIPAFKIAGFKLTDKEKKMLKTRIQQVGYINPTKIEEVDEFF